MRTDDKLLAVSGEKSNAKIKMFNMTQQKVMQKSHLDQNPKININNIEQPKKIVNGFVVDP